MDWSDKVEAYNIDETCARYHNQSTEVQFHPHSTKFEERWVPPSLTKGSCTQTHCPSTLPFPVLALTAPSYQVLLELLVSLLRVLYSPPGL